MAVQPEAQKKSIVSSALGIADDVFTRVTAGINAGEMRRMLRGEAPGRPNPRLKPHSEAFLLHIKPTYYHESVTRFTHTFRLGLLSTYLFFVETITGIILMIWYAPTPERAYTDMIRLLANVPFGQVMRDLHRLGAEMMVAVVTLHMVRTYLTGSYKPPRQFTWFTGVILLVVTLFLSFSGYLLPWDQLAYWAVTIGTSMAEAVPPKLVGETVNLLARGAPDIGANGLMRFYLLHVFFLPADPFPLLLCALLQGRSLRHQLACSRRRGRPRHCQQGACRSPCLLLARRAARRGFLPDRLHGAHGLSGHVLLPAPLGIYRQSAVYAACTRSRPGTSTGCKACSRSPTRPSPASSCPASCWSCCWRFPIWIRNPSRRGKDRRVAIISGVVAGIVMIILSWMGTPYYAVRAPRPSRSSRN